MSKSIRTSPETKRLRVDSLPRQLAIETEIKTKLKSYVITKQNAIKISELKPVPRTLDKEILLSNTIIEDNHVAWETISVERMAKVIKLNRLPETESNYRSPIITRMDVCYKKWKEEGIVI